MHLLQHWRSGGSILHVPVMRRLFVAQMVSSMGTAGALLAVAYVSYQHSESIVHTVIVVTAYSVPAVIVGPWAGRLADTADRRRVIVATQLAQMAVWIGLLALDLAGLLNPAWLTVSSLLAGTAGAIQFPSFQELERQLVRDEQLDEANAVLSSAGAIARIAGAVVGGFVLTWTGPAVMFGFNTVTYVPMIVLVRRLQLPRPSGGAPVDRTRRRDVLAYVRRQPKVRKAIRTVAALTLLAVPIASLLPKIADELGEGAHVLGLITAFYSLGGSLVAAVLRRLTSKYDPSTLIDPMVLVCAASLLVIGVLGDALSSPGRQIAVVALLVPIGLGLALAQAVLSSTVQLACTPEMEGQVIALYAAAISLVAPVGAVSLAIVSEARSVWLSVAIAGGVLTVISAVAVVRGHGTTDPAQATRARRGALAYAAHLGRFAEGFFEPGRFSPLTVRRGADRAGPEGHTAPRPGG